jgi:hypothetical protein
MAVRLGPRRNENYDNWLDHARWHAFGSSGRLMTSLRVLKGCFGSVVLVLLGAAAYFQAFAVNRLLTSAIGNAPTAPRAAAKPRLRPAPLPSAASLLARNAFDSVTGPLQPATSDPAIAPVTTTSDLADPLSAPVCDSPRLFIVSEFSERRWSMATLQGLDDLRPRTRRVGDDVEHKRVEYIGVNPRQSAPAVWLSSGGRLCQAVLFGTRAAERARTAAKRSSSSPAAEPERLRIVPEFEAGKLLGVRLFGIQPTGAFATIGLVNGDRLEAINNLPMNSLENALSLYGAMRNTSDFNLRITRRGRSHSITLHLE